MKNFLRLTFLLYILVFISCSSTSKITNSSTPEKTIASAEYVELNGTRQYILIRGNNTDNPILLYLHGGPGSPETPLIRYFNSELEKHFIVVCWEQRGSGKSYSRNIQDSTMNVNQFIDDGHDLCDYLLKRFHKEKLFIIGHSWGSFLGVKLATEYPELFYAYIGTGQVVDLQRAEKISYRFTLDKAAEMHNKKALKELNNINFPEYLTIENNNKWFRQIKTQRKWLVRFGGALYNQKNYSSVFKILLHSKEYSLFDILKYIKGSKYSLDKIGIEYMKTNFLENTTQFKIPVYILQGKYDYNVPTELVYEYFEKIEAPDKKLFIFENSAHSPCFEENDKFNKEVISIENKILGTKTL